MNKPIFIDRDGVINKDPGGWTEHSYVTGWEDFHFLPGAKVALKRLSGNGYDIIIISNQGGVSKGYFLQSTLDDITAKMLEEIESSGAKIRKVYYCVHQDSDNCACRKPKTGMFTLAENDLGIRSAGAYFIGDGKVDVEAGKSMGLKTILVLSGKTPAGDVEGWDLKPDYIFKDLPEAVNFILSQRH
ncbi:MAG: HAD family hydrolase [Candidatus Omnitrophota bacterium]|nr:HAD family hydrolase [Candidatus Omnitrophota bacterium]